MDAFDTISMRQYVSSSPAESCLKNPACTVCDGGCADVDLHSEEVVMYEVTTGRVSPALHTQDKIDVLPAADDDPNGHGAQPNKSIPM